SRALRLSAHSFCDPNATVRHFGNDPGLDPIDPQEEAGVEEHSTERGFKSRPLYRTLSRGPLNMKKMLLAASAAAVVGGLAFVGSSPAQAQEVEGFQLQIGGFYNALAIVRDQDSVPRVNNDGDVVGKDKIRRYDFNQRGRFTIQGAQTLDNGMTVGFHTQYEMQNNMNKIGRASCRERVLILGSVAGIVD